MDPTKIRINHPPLTPQDFNQSVDRFLAVCEKLGVKVRKLWPEDDMYMGIDFVNGVTVEIDTDIDERETIAVVERMERPRYNIGAFRTTYGGYMEPPDSEFVAEVQTFNLWEAVKQVLLLPKVWEVDAAMEAVGIENYYQDTREG